MSTRASSPDPRPQRPPTSVAGASDAAPAGVAGAKPVTPPQSTRAARPLPPPQPAAPHPDMVVPANVVAEILLTCSSMGSVEVDPLTGATAYVPVPDALQWLQDLQRVLRRDHALYRPVVLLLGKWRVVPQKLLPLALHVAHDRALVLTVCKMLTILTKPLSAEAAKAGRLVVDVKSGKVDPSVIAEQITLRDNAVAQADLLVEYKRLFVRHPSHHHAFQHPPGGTAAAPGPAAGGRGLLSVFAGLLAEPLAKTGSARTAEDHLAIELVLHLIRNLLAIAPLNTFGSVAKSQAAAQLHRDLIIVLREEMVLDVLVCVGQEVEQRENSGYNLLLMEILSHVLRGQDPSDVALAAVAPPPALSVPVARANPKKKSRTTPAKTRLVRTTTTARASDAGSRSLRAHLQGERQKTHALQASRHSHFGGTLSVSKNGRQSYVSASHYLGQQLGGGGGRGAAAQPARRKNKRAEVFVGAGTSAAAHSRPGAAAPSRDGAGPNAARARLALHAFCGKFFQDCYGPVMKSLKNEFRKESSRLENGDRTMFFRIVWFFHQWWRVGRERKDGDGPAGGPDAKSAAPSAAQSLIFTMDVFMFNLVLGSTDEFFEHKKPAALAQTAALYAEMLRTLRAMYDSADPTERMMALGLMDRLYYASEPLDRLPRLLARWSPGMFGREYLCDLAEMTHATLRLLDANAVRCRAALSGGDAERGRPKDAVERMNLAAADFDKDQHFLRRFVSNHILFMYTQLLSQYAVNAAHVNRHIVAYFIRLCKFSLKSNGDHGEDLEFDDALGQNDLAAKTSTLEPMLYNIGLFTILERVLNDPALRDKEDYRALLMFASSFMKRFAIAAEGNPMLYVEALFKHPIIPRFCELTTNMYVSEELRMIAVRDLLLEDQRRYEQQAEVADEEVGGKEDREGGVEDTDKAPAFDDEEEEEVEFNDDDADIGTGGIVKKKRRRKNRKALRSKSTAVSTEEDPPGDVEEDEAEFDKSDAEDATATNDEDKAREQQDETLSSEAHNPPAHEEEGDNPPSLDEADKSPALSGKKRIRKSQEADMEEESDEEDFVGASASVPPSKMTRRVIFEDDDDD